MKLQETSRVEIREFKVGEFRYIRTQTSAAVTWMYKDNWTPHWQEVTDLEEVGDLERAYARTLPISRKKS